MVAGVAQYVFKIEAAEKLMEEIRSEAVEVSHTNKAGHTNRATAPKWRMFLELSKAAQSLAKDLQLNPASAPLIVHPKGRVSTS